MTQPVPRHALVLAVSADFAFAAGTCLLSFLAKNPAYQGDILVLHDGLSPAALQAFGALSPRLRTQLLSEAEILARLSPSPIEQAEAKLRVHPYTLAKFELFDWLEAYDHLVWLDSDTLIRGDIRHLWQIETPLGWRPMPQGALDRRAKALATLGGIGNLALPNGGVIAVRAKDLRALGVSAATLYALAREVLTTTPLRTLDETALWLLAMRQGAEVTALDLADNHPVAQEGSAEARVLHAIGADKFWTATPLIHACPDWHAHQQTWQSLGGPPAPEAALYAKVHPLSPASALTAARNRHFWQPLWPALAPLLPPELWPDLRTDRAFLRLHLRGAPEAFHIDLIRGANDARFQLSLGLEHRLIDDPTLPARVEARLAGLDLKRHDGRRILAWSRGVKLDALPEALAALTAAMKGVFSE